jgi:hypothetical protein
MRSTSFVLAGVLALLLAGAAEAGQRNDWFDDWRDHRFDRAQDNWSFRAERHEDRQAFWQGDRDDKGAFVIDRAKDRHDWRVEHRDDRGDFWSDLKSGHGDD